MQIPNANHAKATARLINILYTNLIRALSHSHSLSISLYLLVRQQVGTFCEHKSSAGKNKLSWEKTNDNMYLMELKLILTILICGAFINMTSRLRKKSIALKLITKMNRNWTFNNQLHRNNVFGSSKLHENLCLNRNKWHKTKFGTAVYLLTEMVYAMNCMHVLCMSSYPYIIYSFVQNCIHRG